MLKNALNINKSFMQNDDQIICLAAFTLLAIGSYILYKTCMSIMNKSLQSAHIPFHKTGISFFLFETYIKSITAHVMCGILAVNLIKSHMSSAIIEIFCHVIFLIICSISFISLVYLAILPKHEKFRILNINSEHGQHVLSSIKRICVSTITMYTISSVSNILFTDQSFIIDITCRTLLLCHYILEVSSMKNGICSVFSKNKALYVGPIMRIAKNINKNWSSIYSVLIALMYAISVSTKSLCFNTFAINNCIIFLVVMVFQTMAVYISVTLAKSSSYFNSKGVQKQWLKKFKRHVYLTGNVGCSIIYMLAIYVLIRFLRGNYLHVIDETTATIYSTVKSILNMYFVFFTYKCISLYISYKTEIMYLQKNRNAKRLKTILPIISKITEAVLIIVGVLILLANYNIDITPIYTAIIGLGIPIGMAAKNTFQSLLDGVIMLLEDDFDINDVIVISGITGVVEKIGIRALRLRENTGALHVIPYSKIDVISNKSRDYTSHYMEIYTPTNVDLNKFIEIVTQTGKEIESSDEFKYKMVHGFKVLGIKGFDNIGTKIAWKAITKPDPGGIFYDHFCEELRSKLLENGIDLPIAADRKININMTSMLN